MCGSVLSEGPCTIKYEYKHTSDFYRSRVKNESILSMQISVTLRNAFYVLFLFSFFFFFVLILSLLDFTKSKAHWFFNYHLCTHRVDPHGFPKYLYIIRQTWVRGIGNLSPINRNLLSYDYIPTWCVYTRW